MKFTSDRSRQMTTRTLPHVETTLCDEFEAAFIIGLTQRQVDALQAEFGDNAATIIRRQIGIMIPELAGEEDSP